MRGWCLHDLGRPAEAGEILDARITQFEPGAHRARVRYQARAALAYATVGELEHASELVVSFSTRPESSTQRPSGMTSAVLPRCWVDGAHIQQRVPCYQRSPLCCRRSGMHSQPTCCVVAETRDTRPSGARQIHPRLTGPGRRPVSRRHLALATGNESWRSLDGRTLGCRAGLEVRVAAEVPGSSPAGTVEPGTGEHWHGKDFAKVVTKVDTAAMERT